MIDNDPPSAELSLTVGQVDGGRLGAAEFRIDVTFFNDGPEALSTVSLTNRLPAGSTLRVFPPDATVFQSEGEWICQFGPVPPLSGWSGTLLGTTVHPGWNTNEISVGGDLRDANPDDNRQTVGFLVANPIVRVAGGPPEAVTEGGQVGFTVRLDSPSPEWVSVDYLAMSRSEDSATPELDYVPVHGTLSFAPGVTNLTVNVPLIDDRLYEPEETFSMELIQASGAEADGLPAVVRIIDNDSPPLVDVEDVTYPEGDESIVARDLIFTLSTTSALPVVVYFAVTDSTGPVPEPGAGSTYVYFFPGQERVTVPYLFVHGNTTSEPDKIYRVVLGFTAGATRARSEGRVTIVNDDAVHGRLDHFVFGSIPSLRLSGRPFSIEVRAVDAFGDLVNSFAGSVSIHGSAFPTGVPPNVLSDFVGGVWTGQVVVSAVSTNVVLTVDDGAEHLGTSPPFRSLPMSGFLKLPARVTEGAGLLANAGEVTVTTPYDEDIDFTLIAPCCLAGPLGPPILQVPATARLLAGHTNVTFDLTILDDTLRNATRSVSVAADAAGVIVRPLSVRVDDNESAVISLALPVTIAAEGTRFISLTVNVFPPPDTNINLFLTSSAPARVSLPATIGLRAGATSVVTSFSITDDKILQGPETVELRAHVENWVDGVAAINLTDNEPASLRVGYSFQGPFWEWLGLITNGLIVEAGGVLTSNLVVALQSSDPGELIVPESVTLLAGQSRAVFPITLVDDHVVDGSQPVRISASAPGFTLVDLNITVQDVELTSLLVAVTPQPTSATPLAAGNPFLVSVSPRNIENQTVLIRTGIPLQLIATRANGTRLRIDPSDLVSEPSDGLPRDYPFAAGWFRQVTAFGWGSNVVITARTTNGLTGQSPPLTIVPPDWSAAMRLSNPQKVGNDLYLPFAAHPGFTYRLEHSPDVLDPTWSFLGEAVTPTDTVGLFIDRESGSRPRSFYRLILEP